MSTGRYSRADSRHAAPLVAMDKRAANSIACLRCGRKYEKSHHANTPTPEFCADCRSADPWCITAMMGWADEPLDRLNYPLALGYGDDQPALEIAS